MQPREFREEADRCREQALAYVGQAEGEFLLRVASAFEELARETRNPNSHADSRSGANAG